MEEKPLDHQIGRYLFLAILLVFALLLYYSLSQFFTAFLGAVIFYILCKRLMYRLIKKRGWKRTVAAVYVLFVSAIIIMIPIGIISYLLFIKGKYYLAHPDLMVQSLRAFQQSIQARYGIAIFTDANIAAVKAKATGAISSLLNEGLNFFGTITMLYFFLYFMLININKMEAAIVFYLPFKREKIELFGKELVNLTFSNSVGVPAIAVAQGLCGYIAYIITGVPEAGFWAVITGFASVVPIIGTALVWLPISIYLFAMGENWQAVFMFVWGLVVLGLTDNVVRFVLAKKMADVHPIITVLGVIMGIKYFGISGLVFGPVLISYFIILLRLYYLQYQHTGQAALPKKNVPIRFNLPFLGSQTKRRKLYDEGDRGEQ